MKKVLLVMLLMMGVLGIFACFNQSEEIVNEPVIQGNQLYQSDFMQSVLPICFSKNLSTVFDESHFIQDVLSPEDTVEMTPTLRIKFNSFAKKYYWRYLPAMSSYQQLIANNESTVGADPLSAAVFYCLRVAGGQLSAAEMELMLSELFAGYEQVPVLQHQTYPNGATYEDGVYSLLAESSPDFDRDFYLLNDLDIKLDAKSKLISLTMKVSRFSLLEPNYMTTDSKEMLFEEHARRLALTDLELMENLIGEGSLDSYLEPTEVSITTMIIDTKNRTAKFFSTFLE